MSSLRRSPLIINTLAKQPLAKQVANIAEPVSKLEQLTPPLKWAGGKRWLVPYLQKTWQNYSSYRLVEPFCGGLAIALGLQPNQALLNDINPHVVNFYKCLQHGLKLDIEVQNDREFYYTQRVEFNRLIHSGRANTPQAAQIFYYLNRTGYNGLCRFNRNGGFNVPFGRHRTINYTRDFSAYKLVFAEWNFINVDFAKISVESGDFIYADPPYDVDFRQYTKNGFEWTEQERLARWLAQHNCPMIASNQATPRILELYQDSGFKIHILNAPRRISCNGDRIPAKEMLAYKGFAKELELS
ncbi:MAG: Dam family site-specific DNA-(adenine-N6)-methyltransferase [Pseudanabaena sp. M090S1SP1A06QC]|jgi:DNA adenine methylase|nr:Dam family site-specific DNA-(adenine-N6)-methyltransferase [Pseudanabaena sp. M53BS1SP1A06MG]MCA6584180.1 Dam family site-specific DNA-(adenine-N6)-methyltransferase [Pseudanabaena sp. M34BS1SP1A06MG]MCA6584882.1 Dam family site-specific DNA-(adenine-N6)-methyltransferase [Pseudanabaena sp. M051S1SP1A06QC]MCA6591643.1 Dam family site-specific DNA-(adenine-N6)-methyltransferase [Pseudanabaena sp. M38BS1SP1A06MG]MCA6596346.1 Dam family site-specific DNA-(adenine-N6)-methyltransferase [Pseudan